MNSVPKLATPFTAATVVVPPSTAPAVPVPDVIATVTFPANAATTFPSASSAATFTAGVIWWSATALVGCTVNTSCVAWPAWMAKLTLELPVSPVAEAASE